MPISQNRQRTFQIYANVFIFEAFDILTYGYMRLNHVLSGNSLPGRFPEERVSILCAREAGASRLFHQGFYFIMNVLTGCIYSLLPHFDLSSRLIAGCGTRSHIYDHVPLSLPQ